MDNLPGELDLTDNDTRRVMWNTYSPIALFASAQEFIPNGDTKRNHLVPVAIQMDYTPGLVYLGFDPVYTSVDLQLSSTILLEVAQATLNVLFSDVLSRW